MRNGLSSMEGLGLPKRGALRGQRPAPCSCWGENGDEGQGIGRKQGA